MNKQHKWFKEQPKQKKKDTSMQDAMKTGIYVAGTAMTIGIGTKILQDL